MQLAFAAAATPTPIPARPKPTPLPTAGQGPTATRTRTPAPSSTPTPTPTPTSTPRPASTPTPSPGPRNQARPALIGRSQQQRDIVSYALGSGPISVAIVGGMHGAYEANTEWLVWDLLHVYEQTPEAIPSNMTLVFLPEANPDGMANGTRFLADGVDPNRNWPTADWSPEAFGPAGELDGGGGIAPMSEPETVTLANWIQQTRPVTILSFHSAGGLVMGGPLALQFGLVDAYLSAARGYVYLEWSYYPVTGDFAQWAEDQGIPTVEVELLTHADPDTERSLAGVQAVLDAIHQAVPSP